MKARSQNLIRMFQSGFSMKRTFLFCLVATSGLRAKAETPGKDFSPHVTAGVPQTANLPITGRESQLCCV